MNTTNPQARFGTHGCLESCPICKQGCTICRPCDPKKHETNSVKIDGIKPQNQDPKQQLVERIRKMSDDHQLEWEVPIGKDALVVFDEFLEAIASAWLEDVEKRGTEAFLLGKYGAYSELLDQGMIVKKRLPEIAARVVKLDDQRAALTNKSKEQ